MNWQGAPVCYQRVSMKRDDVLEIANRLKSEGRAISPVTVCLEAYGQALPEIAETLQQWHEERIVSVDPAFGTLPTPDDFGEVMRDAIERCWAVAQKGVRGQVDAEMRALRERVEQAERETGMLYMDLTRTLSELEACKRKVTELQHSGAGTARMIAAPEADAVAAIADGSAHALDEESALLQSDRQTSAHQQSGSAEEQESQGQPAVPAMDECAASGSRHADVPVSDEEALPAVVAGVQEVGLEPVPTESFGPAQVDEAQVEEAHAYEVQAVEVQAYEAHGVEAQADEAHAYEVRAVEAQAYETDGIEAHGVEPHADEPQPYEPQTVEAHDHHTQAPALDAHSDDDLSQQLAAAVARAVAAEAKVQELEAQLANADGFGSQPTDDHAAASNEAAASQRRAEMEDAFSREREALQARLDEAILHCAQWKQRAEQLRSDMAPFKEHAAWVNAQSVGRSALCSRLIVELARVSPGNPLLRKDIQQQIVSQAAQNHSG
jgi:hypothetical protein